MKHVSLRQAEIETLDLEIRVLLEAAQSDQPGDAQRQLVERIERKRVLISASRDEYLCCGCNEPHEIGRQRVLVVKRIVLPADGGYRTIERTHDMHFAFCEETWRRAGLQEFLARIEGGIDGVQ